MKEKTNLWGLQWRSKDQLDGVRRHLIYEDCWPKLFHMRKEARKWNSDNYGYIKTRKDLQREPHGWRLPKPVKIIAIEYKY